MKTAYETYFKNNVMMWLAENNISLIGKRVRCYNTKRYGLEVRIYNEPMEIENTRKSFRETSRNETTRYGTRGIHSRKVSTYTHINEDDFKNEEEKKFILDILKK